jgi:transcriptional regulator with XRE-family HTH domain
VAQLTGVSVEYVVRLEQGRGPQPSQQVLTALSRALRLDTDERDQLFRLAGDAPPLPRMIEMTVRPSILRLLERISDLPALIISAKGDVLAQNAMSAALAGDMMRLPCRQRNMVWQRFMGDGSRVAMTPAEAEDAAAHSVATLKLAQAKYPQDPDLNDLVAELKSGSLRFATMWTDTRSAKWRSMRKTILHPDLGPITLDCDMLIVPDTDQAMIVYSAPAGAPEATALALLRVTHTEQTRATSEQVDSGKVNSAT